MDVGGGAAFGCDFYNEEDDCTRSAVLSAIPDVLGSSFGDDFLKDAKPKATAAQAGPFDGNSEASSMAVQSVMETRHKWFDEESSAPALPHDPFFHLEETTVFLGDSRGSAATIGNRLLSYFDTETTATVSKVSQVKFAIKAKLECQGFNCELKVRIYRQDEGHAVEFQRRDGEVFVFTTFFERAASCLRATTPSGSGLRAVSHLKAAAVARCCPHIGVGAADTELVMLPLLRLGTEASKFGFPSEAPLAHGPLLDHLGPELDAQRSFWGPLAITVA